MTSILSITNKELAEFGDIMEFSCDIREKASFTEDLIHYLQEGEGQVTGAKLPWSATHTLVGFRPQEISVWAGYSYQGKSLLMGQVALEFARQNERTLIISLEMPPRMTMYRLLRQATMNVNPSVEDAIAFNEFCPDFLYVYDFVGTATPKKIQQIVQYAKKYLHINHVVIDSLAKVVSGEDDFSAQKDFVNALADLARGLKVHIHIVHHLRKPSVASHEPNKHDIKGSGGISDMADNIFLMWKVPGQKDGSKASNAPFGAVNTILADGDYLLECAKQRHGEFSGRIQLWFNPGSLRFIKNEDVNQPFFTT